MHRVQLENGLTLVIRPTPSRLAAAAVWLDAGTVDEADDQHGAAHFLEHMLFKGTARHGIGGSTAAIEAMGGELNAFTSQDETVFHAVVDGRSLEDALDVLADLLVHGSLPMDEYEAERRVVLEEVRGYESDPDTFLGETTQDLLFPGHAYGRPITGDSSAVAQLRYDAVAAFRARNHGSDRAILAIAGDVDPAAVERAARRLFGTWAMVGPRPAEVPLQMGPTRASAHRVGERFESLSVELAWRALPIGHPDAPVLDVLCTALGEGPSSLLASRLVVEDESAMDAWSSMGTHRTGGSVSLGFPPRDDRTLAAIEGALDEIASAAGKGLPARLVRRAQDGILTEMAFSSESVDNVAHDLAYYTARHGDPDGADAYRTAIAAVTPADVHRVAAQIFDPARVTVVVLDRKVAPQRLARVVASAPTPPVRKYEPVRHVFENGASAWILPDRSAVCAVHACAIGGALHETKKTIGLAEAWARTVSSGAGDLDASDNGNAWDDVAGGISGFAGRATMGLRGTFPAHHASEALDLFAMACAKPRFDEADVDRTKDELADDLKLRTEHADEAGDVILWEALFPEHPWGFSPVGTARTIEAIGPGALHAMHGSLFTAANVTFAIAGGVDPDEVIEALSPFVHQLKDRGRVPANPSMKPVDAGRKHKRAGIGQAFVALAVRGPGADHADRASMGIVTAMMDSQGGRLFLDLRERKALAYDVWADHWAGFGGGAVTFGLGCDPRRADEAADALAACVDGVLSEPPGAEEVQRYKNMSRGRLLLALERAAARAGDAAEHARFGLAFGIDAHLRALEAVTPASVAAALEWLRGPRVEVVVVPP